MTNNSTELTLVSISIPFSGFYDSWHGGEGSLTEEMIENELTSYGDREFPSSEELNHVTGEDFWDWTDAISYARLYDHYAKAYANAFEAKFEDTFSIRLGLTFEELESPKYYNFSTDRIFCTVPLINLQLLMNQSLKDADNKAFIEGYIRESLTPRDGFSPFYDNDLNNWGVDMATWEQPQLSLFLEAVINLPPLEFKGEESEVWEYYMMSEYISSYGYDMLWEDGVMAPCLRDWLDRKRDELCPDARGVA